MYPQVLLISTNSRTRRVYHSSTEKVHCECIPAKSIADALVQMVANRIDVIIIDSELSVFEVSMFLEIINKKSQWSALPLIVIGDTIPRHLFPKHAHFVQSETDFVRSLSDLCASV